jgi:hypothetical protein
MLSSKVTEPKIIKAINIFCVLVVFIFLIVKCVSVTLTSAFTFDGGMNVQVAENLVKNSQYATIYDGNIKFDPKIQTGVTVIFPVALIFRFLGYSFTGGLAINAIYMIFLALAITYYLKSCKNISFYFISLFLLIFFGTPSIFNYGFGLYGEIPTLFYFLVTLILIHKYEVTLNPKLIFLAGVSLGLGYLTKTVMLISVPALAFMAIFDYLFKRRISMKGYFKRYALMLFGFLIPVSLFETYKFISLGYHAYYHWWSSQLISIMNQAGVTNLDMHAIINKFYKHLDLFSSYVKVSEITIQFLLFLLLAVFACILVYCINSIWRKKKFVKGEIFFSNDFLVLLPVTLSYFGWWLLMTPTQNAWYRRIIDGTILFELCLIILLFLLYQFVCKVIEKFINRDHPMYRLSWYSISILLLAGSLLLIFRSNNYKIAIYNTPLKTAAFGAAEYIKNLPEDAEFFGYDWWQAPVVAFASRIDIQNIFKRPDMENVGILRKKYFIVDNNNYAIDPQGFREVLGNYEHQLVFSMNNILIYKLTYRK